MPAVLSLTAQLFRRALGILADGLAHFFVGGDPLPEAATADNLLFRRRRSSSEMQLSPFSSRTVRSSTTLKFFRINVGFVSDSCRGGGDPHNVQLFRYPVPRAPDFFHRLQAE